MQKNNIVKQKMKSVRTRYGLLLIIILILLSIFSIVSPSAQKAKAASGDYAINSNSWRKKSSGDYFSAKDGCTYEITLYEDHLFPIEEILYSAYQVSINTEKIDRDEEGNIIQPLVKDKDDNELERVKITEMDKAEDYDEYGKRKITFEVTAHEWSAYIFYVRWNNGEEIIEEESDFLFCTNIDNSPPHIELTDGPVFQDNGYYFEFRVFPNTSNDRSANSGFKSVRVYKVLDGEEETISYTDNIKTYVHYGSVLVKKGAYYVEAIDGVGNKSFGKVAQIDYDIGQDITIKEAENILKNQNQYKKQLIDELKQKYYSWQLLETNAEATDQQKQDAYKEAEQALMKCKTAVKEFKADLINNFYFETVTVENFNEESFPHTVYGEKATLLVSLAQRRAKELDKEITKQLGIKNPDKAIIFNIQTLSDVKDISEMNFEQPIEIKIKTGRYKDAAALAVNGESYNKLRLDKGKDWIVIYLPYSHTQINLVIDEGGAENLKWLYFLLIIPVAGGALIFIYRDKIFNKIKKGKSIGNQSQDQNQTQTQDQSHDQNKEQTQTKKTQKQSPTAGKTPKNKKKKK